MNQKIKMIILELKSQFYRLIYGYYENRTAKYMYYRDKTLEYHKKVYETVIELENIMKSEES